MEHVTEPSELKGDVILDVRDLPCPVPVLKARLEVKRMRPGEVLLVLATDAGTRRDFPVFAEQTGHKLQAVYEQAGIYCFQLKVCGAGCEL